MKNRIYKGLAFLLVTLSLTSSINPSYAARIFTGSITYQTFYDDLSPYGTWIDYPGYGHVWNPKVVGDFRPYVTNGNWIYSNEGWAWSSGYPWGWATFHYGRWFYDDLYGWLWVPGYDWSPAWVTWGFVDDYYAWAPLMPGVNVELAFNTWQPHTFYWNICSRERIYDKNLSTAILARDRINGVSSRIAIINNFSTNRIHNYYATGPNIREVERFTDRKIDRIKFKDVDQLKLENHTGNPRYVYRPDIETARPHEFRSANAAKTKPIRNVGEWPTLKREAQNENVERLPLRHEGFAYGGHEMNNHSKR